MTKAFGTFVLWLDLGNADSTSYTSANPTMEGRDYHPNGGNNSTGAPSDDYGQSSYLVTCGTMAGCAASFETHCSWENYKSSKLSGMNVGWDTNNLDVNSILIQYLKPVPSGAVHQLQFWLPSQNQWSGFYKVGDVTTDFSVTTYTDPTMSGGGKGIAVMPGKLPPGAPPGSGCGCLTNVSGIRVLSTWA